MKKLYKEIEKIKEEIEKRNWKKKMGNNGRKKLEKKKKKKIEKIN